MHPQHIVDASTTVQSHTLLLLLKVLSLVEAMFVLAHPRVVSVGSRQLHLKLTTRGNTNQTLYISVRFAISVDIDHELHHMSTSIFECRMMLIRDDHIQI